MLKDEARRGYWCECWTEDLTEESPLLLRASFDAYTAPQADRWVAVALRTISPAFDPEASEQAWEWLYDVRIDTRRALLRSEPCTVSVTTPRLASPGRSDQRSSCRSHTETELNYRLAHTSSNRTRGISSHG